MNKPKKERFTEPPDICDECGLDVKDCEGLDPGTDECDPFDGDYEDGDHDDYYEPSEHDEWMDFDPDC